jgi:hypothetical protein
LSKSSPAEAALAVRASRGEVNECRRPTRSDERSCARGEK